MPHIAFHPEAASLNRFCAIDEKNPGSINRLAVFMMVRELTVLLLVRGLGSSKIGCDKTMQEIISGEIFAVAGCG